MKRDATEQELEFLRDEIAARRKKARIMIAAVLVFMLMGIALTWNLVLDEFLRLVAMGSLVMVEFVVLAILNVRRGRWERLALADLRQGEVQVVKDPSSGEEIAVFPSCKEVV